MVIGIAANPLKKGAQEIGERLMEWCRTAGIPFHVFHTPDELLSLEGQLDVLVAVGGDGSLLRYASAAAVRHVPMLGVNLGRVGFLAEVQPDELESSMESLLKQEYFLDHRMTLSCSVNEETPFICLNDVMLSRNSFNGVAEILISIDDAFVGDVFCDAVIAATPTGSTGYSLSAGGPVLADGLEAIAVTPVCPHTLHIRPIVAAAGSLISMKIKGEGVLLADGQKIRDVSIADNICISSSGLYCDFIRFGKKDLFTLIRDKLA